MKYEDKPYVWWNAKNYPQNAYLEYNWREEKTDQYMFIAGRPVADLHYDLVFQCEAPENIFLKFDVLSNYSVAPIVNHRTVSLLQNICPNDFQYFPLTIVNHAKTKPYENHDYYLINITKEIDSVDRDKSYLDLYDDEIDISGIEQLHFKKNCMGTVHLAREKYYHPLELVSETIVKEFKKHKILGVNFLQDTEAYNRPFPEEYLTYMFPEDPEAAKRYFVSQLNTTKNYEFFKTRIHKMPPEILEALIDMTLSRSSFHAEQCAELRDMLRNKD